jgi:hypothetical protein
MALPEFGLLPRVIALVLVLVFVSRKVTGIASLVTVFAFFVSFLFADGLHLGLAIFPLDMLNLILIPSFIIVIVLETISRWYICSLPQAPADSARTHIPIRLRIIALTI